MMQNMSAGRLTLGMLGVILFLQTPAHLLGQLSHAPEAPTRKLSQSDLQYFENAPTIIDWPAKKVRSLSAFHGLKVQDDPERLGEVLQKVGEKVETFFRTFPNTTSEEVVQESIFSRTASSGPLQRFHYLMLAQHGGTDLALKEYRTDDQGHEAEVASRGSFFGTQGFASAPLHFHPLYQPGERFRYLGRLRIDNREVDVVAFAQRPDNPKIVYSFEAAGKSSGLLVQGFAWIDSETYQILRMNFFLLAPRPDIGLTAADTDIVLEEVHFPDSPMIAWLPQRVIIYITWKGYHFRNIHHYSAFKLFRTKSVIH